jgi:hypothetical protein
VPDVTGETQAIMRIVEVLPAPLGPKKPNASPRATSKSMPSTAISSPKRLPKPRAEISGFGSEVLTAEPSNISRSEGAAGD